MIRHEATTLTLSQTDINDLVDELEERKLQRIINKQRDRVLRTSTKLESGSEDTRLASRDNNDDGIALQYNNGDESLEDAVPIDSFINASPLDNKTMHRTVNFDQGLNVSLGSFAQNTTSNSNWQGNSQSGASETEAGSTQSNPFYRG